MHIELGNNKSRLVAGARIMLMVRDHPHFFARIPGAFYSPAYQTGRWDGKIRFITERGEFETGKLMHLLEVLKDYEVDIEDARVPIKAGPIPQSLNGTKLREYQFNAIKAIKYNKVYGHNFPHGILDMATNAGKTIISAGIFQTYLQPTVFYVKSKELFNQAIKDISLFLPGKVGHLSASGGEHWNEFMVVMVPSVVSKMERYGPRLAKFKVVIVDECDESTAKGFQKVLKYTYNAYVKVGLSGSVFTDKRAEKKEKNEKVRASFGEVLYKIGNTELMKKGFSSDVEVNMHQGNTKHKTKLKDYQWEYDNGIIKSKERNYRIVGIAHNSLTPMLVMVKNHEHIKQLLPLFKDPEWVHHKRKDRDDVVDRFAKGEIPILIGSYILKRGKNFPLMRTLINAGGGDSMENVLQILGRATRKSKTKDKTIVHDFYDKGVYLRRHSYHRLIVYKNEGLKINHLYNKELL